MNILTEKEKKRRKELADSARNLIVDFLPVEESDGSCILAQYNDFYLQVSFSPLHPLMAISFLRNLESPVNESHLNLANEINQKSIIGCHIINMDAEFYAYRSSHWLDTELTKERFAEILERCFGEAYRAFSQF